MVFLENGLDLGFSLVGDPCFFLAQSSCTAGQFRHKVCDAFLSFSLSLSLSLNTLNTLPLPQPRRRLVKT